MRSRRFTWMLVLVILAILLGCSGDNPLAPSAVENQDGNPNPTVTAADDGARNGSESRCLWGYWQWAIDPENQSIEIVPIRAVGMHINVLKFLESGVPELVIQNLNITTDMVEVDVRLHHPFPGLKEYTGFDVRGIFITPGSVSGYDDHGIRHPAKSKTYLLNTDGWTRWWNPTEFPKGDTIFNYIDGKLGNPYVHGNLNATLNGYKYFCDDLEPLEGLENIAPNHRGMFSHGAYNTRHYLIHFDPYAGLIFNYAVDASWEVPDPNPPIAVPDDFPPEANAPEAYRIYPKILENDLFWADDVNKGGHALVEADVYDWQGCDSTVALLNVPGTFSISPTSPSGGTGLYSTYQFDLDGSLLHSSDDLEALISATSLDAIYGIGALGGDPVASYMMLTIPVGNVAQSPIVTGINPDNGDLGEILEDAEVTGTNFAVNAQVSLIDDETGTIVIDADNEVVAGGGTITCDIDLSNPSIVPGEYDVRVTNPDSALFGELDKGFSVNDLAHPWPSWGGGDLNQGASIYEGYGDEYASGTPKWVFPIDTEEGFSCTGSPGHQCVVANDGTIYICTYNSAMYALYPDGTLKWTFSPKQPWIAQCPAIDDEGYVYVSMGRAVYPSTYDDWVYKVDPDSGEEVWSCYLGQDPCYPSVVSIGLDGAVYVYTGSISDSILLHRVNPDGTHEWSKNFSPIAYSYSYYMGVAVLPDGNLVCSGGSTGKIFCFKPDGDQVWEYQATSWTLFPPAVGPEGNVYFSTYTNPGRMWALDSDGQELWTFDNGYYQWASPVVDPNTGNIFIGSRTGYMRCLDNDGDVVWETDMEGSNIDGTGAVDANGDVYVAVGNQPSNPYRGLIKFDGETGDEIWRSDDIGYMITKAPSIGADGTIYLPGYDATYALFAYGE